MYSSSLLPIIQFTHMNVAIGIMHVISKLVFDKSLLTLLAKKI